MKDTRIVPDSSQYQLWRDDKHVATVYDHDDARLFNAAPDLLAACEACMTLLVRYENRSIAPEVGTGAAIDAARAAIAKARGQG